MGEFKTILRSLREKKGMSRKELSEFIGASQDQIYNWETGRGEPETSMLPQIAMFFGVSLDFLVGKSDNPDIGTVFVGVNTVREVFDSSKYGKGDTVRLPVIGTIRAGTPIMAEENIIGYEEVSRSWLNSGEYFLLRVVGESMTGARIFPGDTVLIRQQDDCENGEICAVLVDDEATLKRVYKLNGNIELVPENAHIPRMVLSAGSIRILGKVKKVIFEPK